MKKLAKSLLAIVLAVMMVVSLGACNRDPNEVGGETIITSKTQLYVSNFNGGVGHDWLDAHIKRFQEVYAEHEFIPGTKGVQVHVNNHKSGIEGLSGQMKNAPETVTVTRVPSAFKPSILTVLMLAGSYSPSQEGTITLSPSTLKASFSSVTFSPVLWS